MDWGEMSRIMLVEFAGDCNIKGLHFDDLHPRRAFGKRVPGLQTASAASRGGVLPVP